MMPERSVWALVSRLLVLIIMAVTPDPQYITAERFTQLLLSPQLLLIASINLSSPHTGNAFLPLKTRLPVGQCWCLNNTMWIITTKLFQLQLIDFMNLFYASLDARISKFKVYNVHTMADEFMVVSGMPNRIGNYLDQIINTFAL